MFEKHKCDFIIYAHAQFYFSCENDREEIFFSHRRRKNWKNFVLTHKMKKAEKDLLENVQNISVIKVIFKVPAINEGTNNFFFQIIKKKRLEHKK